MESTIPSGRHGLLPLYSRVLAKIFFLHSRLPSCPLRLVHSAPPHVFPSLLEAVGWQCRGSCRPAVEQLPQEGDWRGLEDGCYGLAGEGIWCGGYVCNTLIFFSFFFFLLIFLSIMLLFFFSLLLISFAARTDARAPFCLLPDGRKERHQIRGLSPDVPIRPCLDTKIHP